MRLQQIKRYKNLWFFAFAFGIICHGFMIFNKFSLNDDNECLFYLGVSFSQGRWLIGLFDQFANVLGTKNFSLPVFNGVLCILFMSCSVCVMCEIFSVRQKKYQYLIAATMISFPEIAATLGFMFQAWTWSLALLFTLLGIYLILKQSIRWGLLGSVFICFSLGLYQGLLPIGICICNAYCFKQNSDQIRKEILLLVKTIFLIVVGIILYFLLNKLFLVINNTSMTSYQGMDTWGLTSLKGYALRIYKALESFIYGGKAYPETGGKVYPELSGIVHIPSLVLFFLLCICSISRVIRTHNLTYGAWKCFLALCLPLSIEFYYLMSDAKVHPEMMYSSIMVLIISIVLCEDIVSGIEMNPIKRILSVSTVVIMSIMAVLFVRYDNILYFRAQVEHEQETSYLNRLIERIQSTPGYDNEYPLYLYELTSTKDSTKTYFEIFNKYEYTPYFSQIHNMHVEQYMMNCCGFSPVYASDEVKETIRKTKEFKEMTCYPDDGSIRIIDHVVVVKCAE